MYKKQLILIIIVLVLITGGILIYNYLKSDSEVESNGEDAGALETLETLETLDRSSASEIINSSERALNPYSIIYSLKKEDCSKLDIEFFIKECNNGIDLINKAIVANDVIVCSDKSFDVSTRVRSICIQKIAEGQKQNE